MTDTAATIATYWSAAEARDWGTFGSLLADDVVYDLPQTRTYLGSSTPLSNAREGSLQRCYSVVEQRA